MNIFVLFGTKYTDRNLNHAHNTSGPTSFIQPALLGDLDILRFCHTSPLNNLHLYIMPLYTFYFLQYYYKNITYTTAVKQ